MPKVLFCGSQARRWPNPAIPRDLVGRLVAALPAGTLVIQGKAPGVDSWARDAAIARGLWVCDVPVEGRHWNRYGRRAAVMPGGRNEALVELLAPSTLLAPSDDYVIAVQAEDSPGTQNTIDAAERRGLRVEVHRP